MILVEVAYGVAVSVDRKMKCVISSVIYFQRWRGEVATIVEETGANVHGIIWELDNHHQDTLDKQEGVPKVYKRIQVQVSIQSRNTYNPNS